MTMFHHDFKGSGRPTTTTIVTKLIGLVFLAGGDVCVCTYISTQDRHRNVKYKDVVRREPPINKKEIVVK